MNTAFANRLNQKILEKNSSLCVGLDPRLEWIPESFTKRARQEYGDTLEAAAQAIVAFHREVIDVIAPIVPAIKPQIAFFEKYGAPGIQAFWDTVAYARAQDLLVFGDIKRGDIDSTAQAYAEAYLGTSCVFETDISLGELDAITVNPYLGFDTLEPFFQEAHRHHKGVFVLVKTSNPGSGDIQDRQLSSSTTVADQVAEYLAQQAQSLDPDETYSLVGAVVGATYPDQARQLRSKLPRSIFLVPGFGAQGGDITHVADFYNKDGLGAIINASRSVVYPNTDPSRTESASNIRTAVTSLSLQIQKNLIQK